MRINATFSGAAATAVTAALFVIAFTASAGTAQAQRIENQVAVFAALDKVTARISKLEVALNQTAEFGSLKVTPRVCYSRPATEQPKTTSFVEVDEQELEGNTKRVFTGWMFAESPGINAVEHPVFDIWLTGCAKPTGGGQAATTRAPDGASDEAVPPPSDDPIITRRRIRR